MNASTSTTMAFIPSATDSIFPHFQSQDFKDMMLMRKSCSEVEEDEMSDEGSQMLGEKKRRLNMEQVKALEKSFELANKLEPDRKMQLARALGLQPRQVAIWFQNRRARWKTKQLEKDYDVLKRQFEALKADNDALKSQNKNLQTQLLALKTRESSTMMTINLNNDNEGCGDNVRQVNMNKTTFHGGLTQLLHNDGAFTSMFDDQNQDEFWPWSEQHHHHHHNFH